MAALNLVTLTVSLRVPGLGYIAGEPADSFSGADGRVSFDNVPGRAEIDIFIRAERAWIRRQVSRSDGSYLIEGLPLAVEYDVIGRDLTGVWDDVIVGRVQPYAPPQITTASMTFTVGNPATTQMAAQYGGEPFIWSADTLPPGLVLSAAGLWSGTPTAAGSYVVTVTVTDTFGETGARTYTAAVT